MKYKYLDHTSEAKFQAYGKTLEEALGNSALAMFGLILDPKKVKPVEEKTIEITGKTPLKLLFNFLDELIYIQDQGFLLNKVKELKLKDLKIKAILIGDSHKNYETMGEVKAPTYNDMKIELDEKTNIYIVQCVVDV